MTLNTLKLFHLLTKVHRVLKLFVSFVTKRTRFIGEPTKVDWMIERSQLERRLSRGRIENRCVADVAIVSDHPTIGADVFSIVTTETTLGVQMPNVVRMRLPVRFHLREKVRFEDPLCFRYCGLQRSALLVIDGRVVLLIERVEFSGDGI